MNKANKIAIMVKAQPNPPDVIFMGHDILNILEDNPEPCDTSDLDGDNQTFCGIPYKVIKGEGVYVGYKLHI